MTLGGAGHRRPAERDEAALRRDIQDEVISAESADACYGARGPAE